MKSIHSITFPGRASTADNSRNGVILVCVLVCLSVSTAMVFAATRQSLEARRQGRMERQLRQTEWLLHAGVGRASAGLRNDIDYAGETWEPRAALPEYESVVVEIRVSTVAEADSNGERADDARPVRSIEVIARLARGDSTILRTQRSIRIPHSLNSLPVSSNPTASSTALSAAHLEARTVGILDVGGVNPRWVVSSNLSLRPEGLLMSWYRWPTPPAEMCRPFGAEELVIACDARRCCFIARAPTSNSVENVALRELGRVDFRLACLHPSVPE